MVLLAAVLRFWRIGHGLPDLLDEDYPFRRALEMWGWDRGRVDWNPHFFIYPSLTIYLHFFVQLATVATGTLLGHYSVPADYRLAFESNPTVVMILARGLQVACDLLTVVGVMRLAERLRPGAAIPAGLLAALSPVLIVNSRSVFCDTQLGTLTVWALERTVAWRQSGGAWRLASATALAGLAAGAKYPGGMLVIPLVWSVLARRGMGGWRLAVGVAAAAFGVFLLSSPFVLLDYAAFRRHFDYEIEHVAVGHFGHVGRASVGIHLQRLVGSLGWIGVVALGLSLVLAIGWRRAPREAAAERVVWTFALPFAVTLALARIPMDRYLIPLIAVGAALVVSALMWACDRLGARRSAAMMLAFAALLLPVAPGGLRAGFEGGRSTRSEARAWCEAHLTADRLLVQEGYGARLLTRDRKSEIARTAWFAAADSAARRRWLARRTFHAVVIPVLTEGQPQVRVNTPDGRRVILAVFPFAADLAQIFYDPRLVAAGDYVLTSSAIRGRFEADPERFAAEVSLYRFLDREARLVARIAPDAQTVGPDIRIYQLGDHVRESVAQRHGELPILWWAERIPAAFRDTVERLVSGVGREGGGGFRAEKQRITGAEPAPALTPDSPGIRAVTTPDGRHAAWVSSLEVAYARRIAPFVLNLARELADLGRFDLAWRLATANLAMIPDEEDSFRLLLFCAQRTRPLRARAVAESTLLHMEQQDPRAAALWPVLDGTLRP